MGEYFWDSQFDYLTSTRAQMWNDDYFAFLADKVWKLKGPLKIIDFGCGYGYLGAKLLPLLDEGSAYTGIDMGGELLKEARRLFENTPYRTEFINMDLREYIPRGQYDVAICQAVLRHIPQAETVLKKMIDSVVPSGRVICIEVNRRMENAGLYIHGHSDEARARDEALQKQWEDELKNGGRDYMFGIRAPVLMERLGLKDVGVRVNDFVEFISPKRSGGHYEDAVDKFLKLNNLENINMDNEQTPSYLLARSLIISYGTK